MRCSRIYFGLIILALLIFSLGGCALLQIPLKLVEAPFSLLSQILKIVDKLPKPPPWVFL